MKFNETISRHFDFSVLIVTSVFFIPFFGLSSTIDPVLMPRFLVWSIMLFILSTSFVIRLYRDPSNIDCSILRRIIFSVFLGYFLFSLISLTKAVNVTEGVYEVLKVSVSIVYLFLATIILNKNKNYIPILIKTIIVAATVLSLIGFYEYFTYGFGKSGLYPITGTMAQRNQFSSALFLMLPFCLYSVLGFCNYWKVIGSITTISMLTLILLNQTRSVWLALFVSTCITIIAVIFLFVSKKIEVSKENKALLIRRVVFIVIILILTVSIYGFFYLRLNTIDQLTSRLGTIFSPGHGANAIRISMWKQTLELAQDNFILGAGVGNWKIAFPSYGIEDFPNQHMFKTLYFVRPENDYVWILSEVGILGFVFYLSLFAIVITYIFKILTQSSNTDDKLLSILVFFGILGYMVFSCFTFPRERIFHSMFLLLMMAVVISIYHRSFGKQEDISRLLMFVLAIPCLCLLLFAIYIGHARLTAEIYTKRAFAARKAKVWPAVISEIDKGYSVFATLDPMSTPLKWYRGEANFLLNNVSQALEDFKEAYRAHPYHIHVLNNLATCYELQGNHNEAVYYYKKALEIYPAFEDALINLGATYYNSGRYEEAYETLLRCNQNAQNPRLKRYLEAVKEKLH